MPGLLDVIALTVVWQSRNINFEIGFTKTYDGVFYGQRQDRQLKNDDNL
jgi:hypothetical protein